MLHAIGSLLDDATTDKVRGLWDRIEREFGFPGRYVRPWVHVSYHVAGDYDQQQLEPVLAAVAQRIRPFELVTTGLGLFGGKVPMLFIPAVRTPGLQAAHEAVWSAIGPGAPYAGVVTKNPSELYTADRWMPHISLAMGEADAAQTGRIVESLVAEPFLWRVPIDNLVLIYNPGPGHEVRMRFPLGG
ncbi:MAG: 2'-5' RNA ligase family protein [Planctomycetota bacterium]